MKYEMFDSELDKADRLLSKIVSEDWEPVSFTVYVHKDEKYFVVMAKKVEPTSSPVPTKGSRS